jgi:hypothetical protein
MNAPQTPLPESDYGMGGWAIGWIAFAGVMMIMIGIFQAVDGIVGIFNDDLLVQGPKYTYSLSTTSWGWIHLILGIIIVIAGIGLFSGNLAARIIAITLAVLSAIANFLWLPYYPVWSIIVIALNVAVIWALTAHGAEMRVRD